MDLTVDVELGAGEGSECSRKPPPSAEEETWLSAIFDFGDVSVVQLVRGT